MTSFLTVICRDKDDNIVHVENAPQNKTFSEVEEIVKTGKYDSFEIQQNKLLYDTVEYMKTLKEQRYYADKREWNDICQRLDDIEWDISHLKDEIYEKLEELGNENL